VITIARLGRAPTTGERDAFVADLVADPLPVVVHDLVRNPEVDAWAG
jgi:hypothetical protein